MAPSTSSSPDQKQNVNSGSRHYTEITADVHRQLVKASKDIKKSKVEYASAAISYFAERGLNPMSDRVSEGMLIQTKIADGQAKTEQMITALGNRLFGWLTQHEKNIDREVQDLNTGLFGYLRSHESTLFSFLRAMDKNIHEHLADQEEAYLMPLVKELLLTNIEALYTRRLGEQIIIKVLGRDINEYPAKHKEFNLRRDADVKKKLDAFLEQLASIPATTPVADHLKSTGIPGKAQAASLKAASASSDTPRDSY